MSLSDLLSPAAVEKANCGAGLTTSAMAVTQRAALKISAETGADILIGAP